MFLCCAAVNGVGLSGRIFVGVPSPVAWAGVGLAGRTFDGVSETSPAPELRWFCVAASRACWDDRTETNPGTKVMKVASYKKRLNVKGKYSEPRAYECPSTLLQRR